jgi:hypothetical protein
LTKKKKTKQRNFLGPKIRVAKARSTNPFPAFGASFSWDTVEIVYPQSLCGEKHRRRSDVLQIFLLARKKTLMTLFFQTQHLTRVKNLKKRKAHFLKQANSVLRRGRPKKKKWASV